MTEITVTPIIRDAIKLAIELPACDETLLQSLQKLSEAESIPLDVLVSVSKLLVTEQEHGNFSSHGSIASRLFLTYPLRTNPILSS